MNTLTPSDQTRWTSLCNDGPPGDQAGDILKHDGRWVVLTDVEYEDAHGTDHDLAHYTARPATKKEAEKAAAEDERRKTAHEAEQAERRKHYDPWY